VEALKSNNPVFDYSSNSRLDLAPYLRPRRGLSGLQFLRPRVEESPKTQLDGTQAIEDGLAQFLDPQDIRIEFQKNISTGEVVSRIIQNQSGRVVREIPVISFFRFIRGVNRTV
jgi:hypothetical protein